MIATFDDLRVFAENLYRGKFERAGTGVFSLTEGPRRIFFLSIPGEPATAVVRAKILQLEEVSRPLDFAKACLAGNFFWSGTNGATLSVSSDDCLYLTERRPLDELTSDEGLRSCVADVMETITEWQERSLLYA